VLDDPDMNSWIPKIDPQWDGAIPITVIYNASKRLFFNQTFSYKELETELQTFFLKPLKQIIMKTMLSLLVVLTTVAFTPIISDNGYEIGDIATDFKLKNIDGNTVSLSDYKDAKGFIVVFTCNTCPYAVAYEDRIEALNKKVC
jgi:hypothetical protein